VSTALIVAKVANDKAVAGLSDAKNADDEAIDALATALLAATTVDDKAVAALVDAKTVYDLRRPLHASRRLEVGPVGNWDTLSRAMQVLHVIYMALLRALEPNNSTSALPVNYTALLRARKPRSSQRLGM
jgi:hypothetical protein